jgi:hypothetical protein
MELTKPALSKTEVERAAEGLAYRKIRNRIHDNLMRNFLKLQERYSDALRAMRDIQNDLKDQYQAIFGGHTICPSEQDIIEAEIELGLKLDPKLVV